MATDAEGTSNETTKAPHETWPTSKYNITLLFTTTFLMLVIIIDCCLVSGEGTTEKIFLPGTLIFSVFHRWPGDHHLLH